MMNNNISKFNKVANYMNVSAELQNCHKEVPVNAAFAIRDGETIHATFMPYEATPVETILSRFDEIDFAILEEIGRSKYLTSLQIYQFILLRGLSVKRQGIRNRLKKLMRLRMIHEYESRVGEGVKGIRFYELDFKGFKIASERGVRFHMGNRYLSHRKKVELEVTESSEDVKRILAGNMIVLNLLMNYGKIETFGVMETLRPVLDGSIMDGCIIRTAANAIIDKDSILLFEVIRSTPNSMQKLSDKVQRYYTLLDNPIYLKANFHGHVALPQLIICGENGEHNRKIDSFLRSSGLWREEDTILYTEDLLNVSGSLRILYELNKDGEKRWYDIPSRMDKRTLKIA